MNKEQRRAIGQVGEAAGVAFSGLWLDAPAGEMAARVRARRNDASDADEPVLRRQLEADIGPLDWRIVPAGGDAADTLRAARRALDEVQTD
jgi:predicted kinase